MFETDDEFQYTETEPKWVHPFNLF